MCNVAFNKVIVMSLYVMSPVLSLISFVITSNVITSIVVLSSVSKCITTVIINYSLNMLIPWSTLCFIYLD